MKRKLHAGMNRKTMISLMSVPMIIVSVTRASQRLFPKRAAEAVRETRGRIIVYNDEICDARFSKACGGLTEGFETAWANKHIPYLTSISDAPVAHQPYRNRGRCRALGPF